MFQKKTIHMKKGHRTVFQNAWSQKTNTLIERTILFQKKLINSYDKNTTEPSSKMPEAKKTNTLIERTILFQEKLINSYDKNATEPSSKMLEAKKTNTFIEKNILFQKSL